MSFNQLAYTVDEDNGPAQPVLVLSNPSSINITVEVGDINITAMGNVMLRISNNSYKDMNI